VPEFRYEPFTAFSTWQQREIGEAWAVFQSLLEGARDSAAPEHVERALDIAMRSAAFETGAIEDLYPTSRGITQSVALQGAMWEAKLDEIGPDVRGHFDAQLEAFEYVLDAATRNKEITDVWIRELHATVCANQATYRVLTDLGYQAKPLAHGAYKTEPNNVMLDDGSVHWYAAPADVSAEMYRLIESFHTEDFNGAHPAIQSAFAHYCLTAVHPFPDGNGRVARALASVFLYRSIGIPLVVFSDQQVGYWNALAAADAGEPASFIAFIESRALDTMAMVTSRINEAMRPVDAEVAAIKNLLTSHGGHSYVEVQATGQRLIEAIYQSAGVFMNELALAPGIWMSTSPGQQRKDCTFWDAPYHSLQAGGYAEIALNCNTPVDVHTQATPFVGVADATSNPFTFIAIDASNQSPTPLMLRINDLHPAISAAAQEQIDGWARSLVTRCVGEIKRGIEGALKRQGLT
jgi:Fic family protein